MQETLSEPYRSSPLILSQLTDLIEVETWGASFEFAHFTDGEIAAAANRVARRLNPSAPRILAGSIALIRAKEGNVGQAWKRRSIYGGVSKPAVAAELWPTLERDLHRAIEAGDIARVPIGRVLQRVAEFASLNRHGWALLTRQE